MSKKTLNSSEKAVQIVDNMRIANKVKQHIVCLSCGTALNDEKFKALG